MRCADVIVAEHRALLDGTQPLREVFKKASLRVVDYPRSPMPQRRSVAGPLQDDRNCGLFQLRPHRGLQTDSSPPSASPWPLGQLAVSGRRVLPCSWPLPIPPRVEVVGHQPPARFPPPGGALLISSCFSAVAGPRPIQRASPVAPSRSSQASRGTAPDDERRHPGSRGSLRARLSRRSVPRAAAVSIRASFVAP
jgi:hypothetical protein